MSFDNLGLSAKIVRSVLERGYTTPTLIQAQAIPPILQRRDVLGRAQTGTGKTASFLLPLLHLMSNNTCEKGQRSPRVLILTPTRELADQVHENIRVYGKYLQLKSTVLFGGVAIQPQKMKLRKGVDFLVATPGRLLDHIKQKTVDLSLIDIFVLDEADRMLDMGFIPDIYKITEYLPEKRQNLLFSATFSGAVRKLADNLVNNPEIIEIAPQNLVSDQVKQVIYPIDRVRKSELLSHLIASNNWKQVLVFTRTKRMADRLSEKLQKEGIRSTAIHGDKRQGARAKALMNFKKGNIRVLVATDVAARGLDITQLPYVINFELPTVASDYVHRIGRTGRAGNEGEAISLVSSDESRLLQSIEKLLNRSFQSVVLPGYEVKESTKKPIRRKRPTNYKSKKSFSKKRANSSTNKNGRPPKKLKKRALKNK